MVRGTQYSHLSQFPSDDDSYGNILAENIVGVIHDHFITFHLDLDIDGTNNSFVRVDLERQDTGRKESPRTSYLKATRRVARTEKEAQVKLSLYKPAEFHVINPTRTTRVGNPVGYKVVPAGTAASLLDPDDPPQRRGAFTNNQVKLATPSCIHSAFFRLGLNQASCSSISTSLDLGYAIQQDRRMGWRTICVPEPRR